MSCLWKVFIVFKFELPKNELEEIFNKIIFTDLQKRIIEYRDKEYSIVKMSMLENVSTSTITREIQKIVKKMKKVI